MKFNDPKNEPLAYLLDGEPTVISGYSLTEFFVSTVLNILFWPLLIGLLCLPFGFGVIGLMMGVIVAGLVIVRVGRWLDIHKEGKPDGYYTLMIKAKWNQVFPIGFVNSTAQWDITRDR